MRSDKEGIAMRSQPLDLGGTPIHRPGTLIGKALEPLEKGAGEILVLLSVSFEKPNATRISWKPLSNKLTPTEVRR